jgi:energy-converting hydrogenase Eha subunit A
LDGDAAIIAVCLHRHLEMPIIKLDEPKRHNLTASALLTECETNIPLRNTLYELLLRQGV